MIATHRFPQIASPVPGLKWLLFSLGRSTDGSIAIEAASAMTALSLLLLGVVDVGMAYSQQMAMSNAVRAGTQFALVRHPSLGPSASTSEALNSLMTIRAVVVDAAQALMPGDPGDDQLDVSAFCLCPDGTEVSCAPVAGTAPTCVARTYVRVALELPYETILRVPGILETFNIRAEHSVRLN